jgi:hypothetical protein
VSNEEIEKEISRLSTARDRCLRRAENVGQRIQALESVLGARKPLPEPDADEDMGKLVIYPSTDARKMNCIRLLIRLLILSKRTNHITGRRLCFQPWSGRRLHGSVPSS